VRLSYLGSTRSTLRLPRGNGRAGAGRLWVVVVRGREGVSWIAPEDDRRLSLQLSEEGATVACV
jgi:hypothetical protein